MAQWRPFAATNEDGTCLWCGRKLRFRSRHDPAVSQAEQMARRLRGDEAAVIRSEKPGDYEDGFFCGLRCAYSFAEALAGHGRRLQSVRSQ